MHLLHRSGLALAMACAALLCANSEARAAGPGVVFVHGMVDQSVSQATTDYWTPSVLTKMSNGLPYLVVGYPGSSCAGYSECSWGSIVDQIVPWVKTQDITSFTVISHSNGASPVRYLLGHSGAVSAQGNVVGDVTSKISRVIFSGPDLAGTPLADQVTTDGTLLNIASSLVDLFGDNYNSPGLVQQRTDNMRVFNANGTFAGSQGATLVGGKPISVVRGNKVFADIFSEQAHCGGYLITVGLKMAALFGWGDWDAKTDGFIGVESSGYFGNIVIDDEFLNHNQSRRDCNNSGELIAQMVAGAPPATGLAKQTPALSSHVPAAGLVCNNDYSGYDYDHATGHTVWRYGCTGDALTHGSPEPDCLAAYGHASGYRLPSTESWNPYLEPTSYSTWGEVCPDSWMGDGICDACLLSKYGFDAAVGSTGVNDCVRAPPGSSNLCGMLTWDDTLNSRTYSIVEAWH